MTSPRRLALTLAALTFLALGTASCGVKSNDSASSSGDGSTTTSADSTPRTTEDSSSSEDETTTTDEGPSDTIADNLSSIPDDLSSIPDDLSSIPEAAKDQFTELYTDMGLSKDQAECLVDSFLDMGNSTGLDPSDMSAMMDLFEKCDISLEDLGEIGSNFGGPDSGN